jgi:hypothetical protein
MRVADMKWTSNGVATVVVAGAADDDTAPKAAHSVLKWGGGHAADKNQAKVGSHALSIWGGCTRHDCFFAHPDKKQA